ncbi:TIGR04282 family arsenosugar biosynthesis glycosyltransferase [Wenzhouxiangella sediminis]|uniref:DUF2064 domain-containing protein n=1 Tax=Wenzhouxiangella sediminis TaxID=1792836 RepID=A0A3E1K9N7_9GAMM|nr:DUF2064 domain-containing protein [Wenzhouxiangella sediminis]RFF30840.1 DUF2064 domain-containing protein [Wenzhouxiangella sediminis]
MTAIAIFVKTPGLSAVKTRLAATMGAERAVALYEQCAAAVAEAARAAEIGTVYWATAEPIDRIDGRWSDLPRLQQGSGGLGERMHRVLDHLVQRHGSGLLLGADAPQVDPSDIRRAAEWLQRDRASSALGPATDGGFWTFGANHVPDLLRWTRVPYSHPDTLRAFRESMGDDSAWLELPTLTDLDTAEDMARVAGELAALPHPLPRQRDLMAQLK